MAYVDTFQHIAEQFCMPIPIHWMVDKLANRLHGAAELSEAHCSIFYFFWHADALFPGLEFLMSLISASSEIVREVSATIGCGWGGAKNGGKEESRWWAVRMGKTVAWLAAMSKLGRHRWARSERLLAQLGFLWPLLRKYNVCYYFHHRKCVKLVFVY